MSGKRTKTILNIVIPMLLIQVQYGIWGKPFLVWVVTTLTKPKYSMYDLSSYNWVVLGVHVGKYTSPNWASGNYCCHHGSLLAVHLAWTFGWSHWVNGCVVCLPTFATRISQMLVNISYMDSICHTGWLRGILYLFCGLFSNPHIISWLVLHPIFTANNEGL